LNLTLIWIFNISTSPFPSSSNNINIGHIFFSDKSGLKINQIGASLPYVIFPLFDQLREILGGMGVVSTMGTPRSSWKRTISCEMPMFITIVIAS